MARNVSWGTPGRTQRFVQPRRAVLLRASLGAGALLLLGVGVGKVIGFRAPLSPGSLSHQHAAYASRCEACHEPMRGATDERCERCHDPAATGRMTRTAHVGFEGGNGTAPSDSPSRECAGCHGEHRGASPGIAGADEARCLTCHGDAARVETAVASFADHPEFGVLEGGERASTGIRFSHLNHVTGDEATAPYLAGDSCARCHQLDTAGDDFVSLSFEATCAGCHLGDLQTGPVPAGLVARLDEMARSVGAAQMRAWQLGEDDFDERDGQIVRIEIGHRDPWVLYNLRTLHLALDPAAAAAERDELETRVVRLERRLAATTASGRAVTELLGEDGEHWRARVATQREELAGAIQGTRNALERLDAMRAPPAQRRATDELMREAIGALTGSCAQCHEISRLGLLAPVAAAQPSLARGGFSHRDHVSHGESCTSCHASGDGEAWSIETSDEASEPRFLGIASCRRCHDGAEAPDGCQACHGYHPGDPR